MRTTTTKLLALGTAAALGLASCGGGGEEATVAVSGEARPVQDQAAAPGGEQASAGKGTEVVATVDDAASTLRSDLTLLLQEHAHLTGLTVGAIMGEGEDGPIAQGAIQALDQNAVALGDVIGALPGVEDPDAFLELWREHVAAYVAYTTARVDEEDDAAEEAMATLEELLQPMADFFEVISGEELVADELFGELETHVTMVTAAIDAMVAGDAEASDLLQEAAVHMDVVAADLSAGLVAAHPDELAGDPLSVPAETRATLTSALVEHTYLSVLTAGAAAAADGAADDPAVQAAVTTLEGGADSLANTLSGASGNEGREAFLDLWRPFLTAISDYAAATAAGDTAAAGTARSTIDAAPAALAVLLQGSLGANAPADLAALLGTHVTNLTAAIDAIVAGDPAGATLSRAAAMHTSTIATGLARAMVAAEPGAADGGSSDDGATGGEDAEGLNADPDTAAPDQSSDSSSGAGSVGTSDAGPSTDGAGPGAGADSQGDMGSQG